MKKFLNKFEFDERGAFPPSVFTARWSYWTSQHVNIARERNWFRRAAPRTVDFYAVLEPATRNIHKTALPSSSYTKYVHSGYLKFWRAQRSVFLRRFKENCIVCIFSGFRLKVAEKSSPILVVQASWTTRMGATRCREASVRNYHYLLRNNPEERSSQGNVCLGSK